MEFKAYTLVEAVLAHAQEAPERRAVCFKKQQLTYGELAAAVRRAAWLLRTEYDVQARDLVMLTALSKPEYLVLLLAVQFLGATSVPVEKSALSASLAELYHYVEPKVFLTDSAIQEAGVETVSLSGFYQRVQRCENALEDYQRPEMEDIAEIIFTTGTTGKPKGVMLSFRAIRKSAWNTSVGTRRTAEDVVLLPLPLNHSFGLRVLRAMLFLGGTVVLQNGFLFPKETRKNIETFGCTGMAIVPASVEQLYRGLGDEFAATFGLLQHLEIGAGSLSVAMKEKLRQAIPNVHLYNVWGSSETGGVIFLDITEHGDHLAALGVPVADAEVRIIGPDGADVPGDCPERAGRMILRGGMEMSGYFHMEENTRNTLVDGFVYTNDLVYRDSAGFVFMLGRADDIINVGGEKVAPGEVENVAGLYPAVAECACIGGSDREGVYEEVPVLFVVPATGEYEEKELVRFLSSKVEQYKIPKYFVELDALPRNRSQKIDRKALKRMWEDAGDAPRQNPVITAIHNRRSIRKFEDRPIPRDVLEAIVRCGCYAPTGHNRQTWRFTVLRKQADIQRMKEVVEPVAKRRKTYFGGLLNPDAVVLVSNDVRNEDGIQDSSCAAQNIMLAAYSYGVGSTWVNALMKLCDEPEVRALLRSFGVPDRHNVWATIALGYPANQPAMPARKQDVVQWVE